MMRNIFLCFAFISLSMLSCKKDNDAAAAADPRDKFVGTWNGNYTLNVTGMPSGSPTQLPTSIVISKSQSAPAELEIKINNSLIQNQTAAAIVSGNQYIYKPLTVSTLTLNGTGQISTDGKTLSESGTVAGSLSFPGLPPTPISGTWTSALTKQ
jgi:hypothetical protein